MSPETKLQLLKWMMLSRYGDLHEQSLIRQGKGWFHIAGMGHEAMAAFSCLMAEEDYAFPYYRDRAFVLGRGLNHMDLALSFFAKKDSSSAGRQLPGHFCARNKNIWSLLSPVAGHWLPAVGAAWGMQMDGKGGIVYASVGEASMRQGDAYEAICFAKERKLPILFVVQDGKVSISTVTAGMNPVSLGVLSKEDWKRVDGCDVNAVYAAGKEAIASIRAGNGPAFLWCNLERLASHSSADDHRNYRSKEELEAIEQKDPLSLYKQKLLSEGIVNQSDLDQLELSIKEMVRQDFSLAENAQDPKPGEEMLNITDGLGSPQLPILEAGKTYRMADAINHTFRHMLNSHPHTYFFGEDIEDPLGGVFRLTKGLSKDFPQRVFNSPLAESTIVGVACGLASYGKFPIFELQFIDFIMPAWNQLVNNIANLRWRSNGDWKCPCILYAPYGGYLPAGGIWHSQAQEAIFAHFPGLHIVVPSTPEDVSGFICTALTAKDPVLLLIPKHLMWEPQRIPDTLAPVPLGKARIRKAGSGLTVVAWGNCLDIVLQAIREFPQEDAVEIIDLRSIQPWDKETIIASVLKTKRLLVVQEDGVDCSVGQMIITTLTQIPEVWNILVAAPILISKNNVHIGFNPIYEYSALPSKEKVLKALGELLSQCSQKEKTVQPAFLIKEEINNSTSSSSLEVVKVPNLGEGLRQAKVLFLLKQEGDSIKVGDALCEIETDKAVFPIEAAFSGVLGAWKVQVEDIVNVGDPITNILINKDHLSPVPPPITPPANQSPVRKALSAEVVSQMQGVLPASLTTTVSMEHIKAFRQGVNRKVTPPILVAWSVCKALEQNPSFRGLIQNNNLSQPLETFDLGIAVALEEDMLEVAVIPNANTLSWPQFDGYYRKAVKEVKNGFRPSKTRTPIILSSMGAYQIREGMPIVVPPANAILFMGDTFFEYKRKEDSPVLEEVATLCITFDHRFTNGAGAARFLNQVKKNIESPFLF